MQSLCAVDAVNLWKRAAQSRRPMINRVEGYCCDYDAHKPHGKRLGIMVGDSASMNTASVIGSH